MQEILAIELDQSLCVDTLARTLPRSLVDRHEVKNPFQPRKTMGPKAVTLLSGESSVPVTLVSRILEPKEETKVKIPSGTRKPSEPCPRDLSPATPTRPKLTNNPTGFPFPVFAIPVYQKKLTKELVLNFGRLAKLPSLSPERTAKHTISLGAARRPGPSKKLLALDIDETLIHSLHNQKEIDTNKKRAKALEIVDNGELAVVYVMQRPFLTRFLKELAQLYEIVVRRWTTSL
jgi:hypothetical protein